MDRDIEEMRQPVTEEREVFVKAAKKKMALEMKMNTKLAGEAQ